MVKIAEICDPVLMAQMISGGYVTARPHASLPLTILNYTPKAQYEWKWNAATVAARGLIYNHETGEVIARPFEKFFNWDQGRGNEVWDNPMPPKGPVIRMEKMDGSLGVLYQQDVSIPSPTAFNGSVVLDVAVTETRNAIATRGSFHSEQAEWATEFLNSQPQPRWKRDKTYLFEIIYPDNRIVVDYGEYEGLVLIDVIDTETGSTDLQEFDDCAWPDKVTRTVLNFGFDSGQAADIPPGDEGFVYLWPEKNYRVKMKSADYIELHRLVSNLSVKSVWEQLVAGKTVAQIKDGLPDEFHGFVDETARAIQDGAMLLVRAVFDEFARITNAMSDTLNIPRKEFALAVKDNPLKKYLFLALDGKPIYPVALAAMKPKADKPLLNEE